MLEKAYPFISVTLRATEDKDNINSLNSFQDINRKKCTTINNCLNVINYNRNYVINFTVNMFVIEITLAKNSLISRMFRRIYIFLAV